MILSRLDDTRADCPASVEFFSQEGDRLGSKGSLEHDIHESTRIAREALRE